MRTVRSLLYDGGVSLTETPLGRDLPLPCGLINTCENTTFENFVCER